MLDSVRDDRFRGVVATAMMRGTYDHTYGVIAASGYVLPATSRVGKSETHLAESAALVVYWATPCSLRCMACSAISSSETLQHHGHGHTSMKADEDVRFTFAYAARM